MGVAVISRGTSVPSKRRASHSKRCPPLAEMSAVISFNASLVERPLAWLAGARAPAGVLSRRSLEGAPMSVTAAALQSTSACFCGSKRMIASPLRSKRRRNMGSSPPDSGTAALPLWLRCPSAEDALRMQLIKTLFARHTTCRAFLGWRLARTSEMPAAKFRRASQELQRDKKRLSPGTVGFIAKKLVLCRTLMLCVVLTGSILAHHQRFEPEKACR